MSFQEHMSTLIPNLGYFFGGLALVIYATREISNNVKKIIEDFPVLRKILEFKFNNYFLDMIFHIFVGMVSCYFFKTAGIVVNISFGLAGAGILEIKDVLHLVLGARIGSTLNLLSLSNTSSIYSFKNLTILFTGILIFVNCIILKNVKKSEKLTHIMNLLLYIVASFFASQIIKNGCSAIFKKYNLTELYFDFSKSHEYISSILTIIFGTVIACFMYSSTVVLNLVNGLLTDNAKSLITFGENDCFKTIDFDNGVNIVKYIIPLIIAVNTGSVLNSILNMPNKVENKSEVVKKRFGILNIMIKLFPGIFAYLLFSIHKSTFLFPMYYLFNWLFAFSGDEGKIRIYNKNLVGKGTCIKDDTNIQGLSNAASIYLALISVIFCLIIEKLLFSLANKLCPDITNDSGAINNNINNNVINDVKNNINDDKKINNNEKNNFVKDNKIDKDNKNLK